MLCHLRNDDFSTQDEVVHHSVLYVEITQQLVHENQLLNRSQAIALQGPKIYKDKFSNSDDLFS